MLGSGGNTQTIYSAVWMRERERERTSGRKRCDDIVAIFTIILYCHFICYTACASEMSSCNIVIGGIFPIVKEYYRWCDMRDVALSVHGIRGIWEAIKVLRGFMGMSMWCGDSRMMALRIIFSHNIFTMQKDKTKFDTTSTE